MNLWTCEICSSVMVTKELCPTCGSNCNKTSGIIDMIDNLFSLPSRFIPVEEEDPIASFEPYIPQRMIHFKKVEKDRRRKLNEPMVLRAV